MPTSKLNLSRYSIVIRKGTEAQILASVNAVENELARASDTGRIFYGKADGTYMSPWGDIANGNYSEFETDGTYKANGNATCFRGELNDLIKSASQNPSSHLFFDYTEGTLDFRDNCDLNDWALMNIQINHDWKNGSDIEPHIHWFQNANNTPNWLIQYRWQKQCSAKTTDWTSKKWDNNACSYTSGTINQITSFGAITPPVGYGQVSDILQVRVLRDTSNTSTLFTGADTYTGDAESVSFDCHIEVDTLGSRQLYAKQL
jgi:hypothetical protein